MKKESFNVEDLVQQGLCTGCGICVSESPQRLKMNWNDDGFLVPTIINKNIVEANEVKVCPFNPNPDIEVKDEDVLSSFFFKTAKNNDDRIGRYENIYVGYANEFRTTSSSGGLATFVFEFLLKNKIVNHLFVVKEVAGNYEYQWFNDFNQILNISKTRYIPVTLENLFNEIDSKEGTVAVSGVACFVKAIRLKQHYYPEYREKIPFVVGIICGGLKSKYYSDFLAQKAGIERKYTHQEYRIKDENSNATDYSFGALNDEDGAFQQIKMNTLGDMWGSGLFKSKACDFCDDVTTELADISLGDAWLQPYVQEGLGNSVIVCRTQLANSIIKDGIEAKSLSVKELSLENFKKSQQGSFNHRQDSLKFRVSELKKKKLIVPQKRERFFVNIPFYFKRVQRLRLLTRKMSLEIWKENTNATVFESKMQPIREKLRKETLFYHRLKKIKRILLG